MHKGKLILIIMCSTLLMGCTRKVEDIDLTIMLNNQEVSGTFTGTLVDKVASGDGTFKASVDDGEWIYTGMFENNAITGNGTLENYTYKLTIPNYFFDVEYSGECLDGLPNGEGIIQGEINGIPFEYNGDFLQGNLSGNGDVVNYPHTISYENNEISGLYTGKLLDGEIIGNGKFTGITNDINFVYDGEWLNGNMSNLGHLTCDNYVVHFSDVDRIGVYDGETNNGIAEGEGTFEAINGYNQRYIYTGSWINGLFNGYGKLEYIDSTDDIIDSIGTFTDGDFTPTPSEFMVRFSKSKNVEFEVSNKTEEFIRNSEIYFGENAITDYPTNLIQDVAYEEYAKKSYAYRELFIETECKVEKIREYDIKTAISDTTTEIYCSLPNDLSADFEIIYFGALPEVYSGAKLKVTGIPVDYGYITNVLGGQNACMFLLASQIEIL